MEQISYIHHIIKKRIKTVNGPYLSSIVLVNNNIPFFEEQFGQLDYDWLLNVTKFRRCAEVEKSVVRHVDGKNLSLDPEYRRRDFYMSMLIMDEDIDVIKSLYGSRARYFYVMGDMKNARKHFLMSNWDLKNILYIITSYNKTMSRIIVKKFGVFG